MAAAAAKTMLATHELHARRTRIASMAVLGAFLLGALWLVSARSIARAVGYCLAVEGSVLRDDQCAAWMHMPLSMAIISVVFMVLIWRRESLAATDQLIPILVRDHLDRLKIAALYCLAAFITLCGKMLQHGAARRLLKEPDVEKEAHTFKIGAAYYDAGFLAFSVVHCCFTIPYVLLKLMCFLRDKCPGSKLD